MEARRLLRLACLLDDEGAEERRRRAEVQAVPVEGVPGLVYTQGLLDEDEQRQVLEELVNNGLLAPLQATGRGCRRLADQANAFPPIRKGHVAEVLARRVRGVAGAFPGHIRHRRPLFDSCAVNRYGRRGRCKPHVDLLHYDDGIAIINLLGEATLVFQRDFAKVRVRLAKGSLLTLSGDSRYLWTHGVEAVHSETRASVVLRRMCSAI